MGLTKISQNIEQNTSPLPSIWAVGRNYADHAKELNNALPQEPFFFLKSGATLVPHFATNELIQTIPLVTHLGSIHYEIEMALKVEQTSQGFDFSHIALALDLTARDKQNDLKNKGLPWTLAKSFKYSCPISQWVPLSTEMKNSLKNQLTDWRFFFKINNIKKQFGNAEDMIFKPYPLLETVLKSYPLQNQDILLTGTPAGVGPLQAKDLGEGQLRYKEEIILEWKMSFTNA